MGFLGSKIGENQANGLVRKKELTATFLKNYIMSKMKPEETEKREKRGVKTHGFSKFLICACILLSTNVLANNVRFNSKPSVSFNGDTVMISFSLSWDHSWRDDFNWDAVWIFGKYTRGTINEWSHLKLLPTGHRTPAGFTFDLGNITSSAAGGLFLMRSERGGGNVVSKNFTIKTMRSNMDNITQEDVENNRIFLTLSAVEMVYIPYGAYYLGDGATADRLGTGTGEPIAISSEEALPIYKVGDDTLASSAITVPATFPKGYKGFYCMKYEVSQDEYVSFLNTLTRSQQQARIGNNLDSLKVGEYVFGSKSHPDHRNGICVLSNDLSKPAIFGCNLNPAEPYFGEDDGKCIACNYLTPADVLAYCDWACLRPMSEPEYEKAFRKPYPQAAVAGEFVWNSASGAISFTGASGISNSGKVNEKPSSPQTNVNYNNAAFGPLRSASFGTSSTTQTQAGATFWGVMEMSGNVAELCYSVDAGSNFNTSDIYASHGNGEMADAVTAWAATPASFIAKGGSFSSTTTDELRISDRSMAAVTDIRDAGMGFRAVHTFGSSSVNVNAGIITVSVLNCTGLITVSDSVGASVTWNGAAVDVPVSYVWYVKEGSATSWTLIPDKVEADLVDYIPTTAVSGAGGTVTFKRKAVSAVGERESAEVTTAIPNMAIVLTPASAKLDPCGPGSVIASIPYSPVPPVFTWTTETGTKTGASYTPAYTDFADGTLTNRNVTIECLVEVGICSNKDTLTVAVSPLVPRLSFSCGDEFTDSRNGKIYPTKQIGTQCWMTKNMNIGEKINGGVLTSHQVAGIQKICNNNDESNCTIYGGLYNWAETINGENIGTGSAYDATAYNRKCATDGSGHTQGICPNGWHVPSDAEFMTLEIQLGMSSTTANTTGYRGTDQGTKLKSISGWNGLLGGYANVNGTFGYFGTHGFWLSSTENSSLLAWRRELYNGEARAARYADDKSSGWSVRCLLN
ncbi:MAG: SUMF1/EgtB/PvdO family nonheme iron enzyme [Culturomica sp.]|jgi:uncharacterized protein (TIGR02145 family)|nr:SUMF1/EgtB/PvdO family nonheme iron enzyme [Culturomica sp.]